jgi:hypothetical protein
MNKKIIKVPKGIRMMSEWTDLLNNIPNGKIILNKKLTGCGATTLFLKIDKPLILCAHRTELLSCKANADLHKSEVCLFKEADDTGMDDLAKNMSKLHDYLDMCNNPFKPMCPKILVTADSLHHVIDVLETRNELNKYYAVSDEMQCIFTDAAFKGDIVLNYLQSLGRINNVIFLSATPYLENYLDQIPEFKDLPYIELDWETLEPGRVIKPDIITYNVVSLDKEIDKIISNYKTLGYFETKTINGVPFKSEQGVFYLNSVDSIVSAIKRNKLTADECNIICSKTNKKTLKKLKDLGFQIGSAQKENEVHVPYTFVTKCSFEGVDLYHPSGYSYIFADPNLENLALDISIDIEQIIGRMRLDSNVFKYNATMFFKTTKKANLENQSDFAKHIQDKENYTNAQIEFFSTLQEEGMKLNCIGQLNSAHQRSGFEYDYLTFCQNDSTKEWEPKMNILVKMSEIRAWDIRNNNYANAINVISRVGDICSKSPLPQLLNIFISTKDFMTRMKAYCDFLESHPGAQDEVEQKSVGIIDYEFHQFYRTLGPEKIKANSYQRSRLDSQMSYETVVDKIESAIRENFQVGDVITRDEAKRKLQEIYDDLGLKKIAKATDLDLYFDIKRVRMKGAECIKLE